MFSSLRNRLLLSHVLPLVIIIPLMGISLIYATETHYIIPSLEKELVGDASLLAQITAQQGEIWQSPQLARALLDQSRTNPNKLLMLLDSNGRILASSDPADDENTGQPLNSQDLSRALDGELVVHTDYSQRLGGEVVDVLAPVITPNQQVIGIVRVAYHLASLQDELAQFEGLIIGILILGLVLGGTLGLALALNINRPIQQATRTIEDLALGGHKERLPLQGPDEIRRLSKSVNFLVERLHELEQARRQLLANLVHELGRPLGALRMAIQVTLGGAKKDAELLDDLLIGMDDEAARLQSLLDDLAHLHDQVLGTLELKRQPLPLADWLPKILFTWQEAARKKRLHWEEHLPSDLPTIDADPARLAQVVGNLVSNAIKYTQPGGTVCISAGVEQRNAWIRVSDTGPGIPAEEREKIFTPFYRGDQGKRVKQGMGLGLSIARDLITAHGGRIDLESVPGLGSHFTIWVPLSIEATLSETKPALFPQ